ncbi:uncharacterized protein BDR25DRAFT_312703 [Lindgomyces ingoldianus]|uniref:Uncharacterized protein n=1 Tax=Lindgomyces ingoldianus TaxID=673940 RepID=A0ACB6R186_9PLEO|nr:uncharacterized protein BDR25DRAFT_312703 [Lindgomyces ingoldianus]KAF2472802.1 hypothetical protein BDR25DRAFT_312703 [Lindgomyces ingoldianus]
MRHQVSSFYGLRATNKTEHMQGNSVELVNKALSRDPPVMGIALFLVGMVAVIALAAIIVVWGGQMKAWFKGGWNCDPESDIETAEPSQPKQTFLSQHLETLRAFSKPERPDSMHMSDFHFAPEAAHMKPSKYNIDWFKNQKRKTSPGSAINPLSKRT